MSDHAPEPLLDTRDLTKLQLGESLFIEPASIGADTRIRVFLLGCIHRGYIITDVPDSERELLTKRQNQFDIRIFTGSEVIAFVSTFERFATVPVPHMFISYPEQTKTRAIRKAPRVSVELPAEIEVEGSGVGVVQCKILDLSTTGCGLSVEKVIGNLSDTMKITFSFQLMNFEKKLTVSAKICNIINDAEYEPNKRMGVEFNALDPAESVWIHGIVYQTFYELTKC